MCVLISSCHSRTARMHVGPGWFAHAREGRGGGRGGAPCSPVHDHHWHITHRYAIVHTCTVHYSRPLLSHAHCPLFPCCTHAFATVFTNPQCTLAQTPQCACQAVLSPPQRLFEPLPPPPSTSSTPRMCDAFTHAHHNSCMHF
jgi:hypothetical protein